jgi:ribosomal protein S18 acetylase RimI-like enzyme
MSQDLALATVEIRPLIEADQPFLWEMLYQALYVPPGDPPLPRDVVREPALRHYVEGWGRPGDLGFVALAGGEPVGAAWLRLLAGDDQGFGHVDDATPELSIALLPCHRGQGIGSALLARLLDAARSHYDAISLSVSTGNPAKGLYEKLGFETVQEEGGSLTMVKSLAAKEE